MNPGKMLFRSAEGFPPRTGWLQAVLLALLIGLVYSEILAGLLRDWWFDDNYSHGFLVPVFAVWVLWQRRKRIAALPPKPSWFGLFVIAAALAMLIAGVLGAELFLSRSSFLFLLAGLVIYFLGWQHLRAMLFPWGFLFLMIPIPTIIYNQFTFPLQTLASRLAAWLLGLVGVPVLREGNVIRLPAMTLEVAEACSGIRSLISLGTLAIIYGYFFEPRIRRRLLLVLAAVPVAVVANGLRIMGTGLLGEYWSPDKAQGFFHSFSGWVIFIFSSGMFFSFHRAMRLADELRGARET